MIGFFADMCGILWSGLAGSVSVVCNMCEGTGYIEYDIVDRGRQGLKRGADV